MTRPKLVTSEGHVAHCPSEECDADEMYMSLYDDSFNDDHVLMGEFVWPCHSERIKCGVMSDEIGTYYARARRYRNR